MEVHLEVPRDDIARVLEHRAPDTKQVLARAVSFIDDMEVT